MKKILKSLLSVMLALSIFIVPLVANAASVNLYTFDFISLFTTGGYTKNDLTMPWSVTLSDYTQKQVEAVEMTLPCNFKTNENDVVTFTYKMDTDGTRYKDVRCTAYFTMQSGGSFSRSLIYSNGVFTTSSTWANAVTITQVRLVFDNISVSDPTAKFYWKAESANIQSKSAESGFWDNVKNALSNILTWLKEIRDKIVNGFDDLGNSIVNQFNNLVKNLQKLFDDVTEWLFNIVDSVQDFMNSVGNWFEKLWNKIWWGNENGESEYVKPTISNKLNDIIDILKDYQDKLKETISTISSSADSVSSYISTGTSFVNGIVGVAGAGFTALITFGIVFVLVRKVVGR